MQEENTKEMKFFNRIIASIKDFEKYQIFAVEKTRKAIKYLVFIMIIFAVIIGIAFTYKFSNSINKVIQYVNTDIDEVTYKDEKLSINSRK